MARSIPLVPPEAAGAEPPFARIGIVGLGLIGGSIALAARRLWPSALVIGVDRNEVIEDAQRAHAVDVGADDLGMLAEADLVVLAAPVLSNLEILPQLPAAIGGTAVVTDVGSAKRAIVQGARELPGRLSFVGGHPLAGAARAGIAYASAELFRGRPWILTPAGADTDAASPIDLANPALSRLVSFVRALGAIPRVMSAEAHDHLAAWISHLPQLAATALMRVVGDAVGPEGLELAGRGMRDATRLATSPAHVWTDICRANGDVIGTALDNFIGELMALRERLDEPAAVEEIFAAAAAWRERMRE